jgi:hypothetical protein
VSDPIKSEQRKRNARRHNYDIGYKYGYAGRDYDKGLAERYPGYSEGWEDGDSDRPSLDELIPLDWQREQSDRCLD